MKVNRTGLSIVSCWVVSILYTIYSIVYFATGHKTTIEGLLVSILAFQMAMLTTWIILTNKK